MSKIIQRNYRNGNRILGVGAFQPFQYGGIYFLDQLLMSYLIVSYIQVSSQETYKKRMRINIKCREEPPIMHF